MQLAGRLTEPMCWPALTATQQRIMEYLQKYMAQWGWAPTIREICTAMGFRSTNAAVEQLEKLAEKGYIHSLRGKARCIRIVRRINPSAPRES